MQPHQERVVQEQIELEEKLTKLNAFLENSARVKLPENERGRLVAQAEHMGHYNNILKDRIRNFEL